MTLADVDRMGRYWRKNPSTRMLVGVIAQFAGWEPPAADSERNTMTADDVKLMIAATGGKMPGLPKR